jgi:VanZ family protein
LSVFFGIGIEIAQELFTASRHAELFDVLANVSGATLAVAFIFLFGLNSKI